MYDNLDGETRDRVSKMLEYWSGTIHTRLIQRALDSDDSEALMYHLSEAEAQYAVQEDGFIKTMPRTDSALVNLRRLYGGENA